MEAKKVGVTKVILKMDSCNGQNSETTLYMPSDVAGHFFQRMYEWRNEWTTTPNTHDKYQKEQDAFIESLKNTPKNA